ncbi:retrovirus-related pol polyprotein from transposon TNT 1-94 [Tanacetum coccineum]
MASSVIAAPAIPLFSRTHYHIWAIKMKTYLKSQGLWKVVETDESTPALGENPTVAQLRTYDTESLKKDKALTCLHSGIADQIFTSIMDLETPKAVWDKLQETFEGTDRVKAVRLLTLKREFELLRMKDDELVKDYSARMVDVVNQMRLHGEVVKDQKVVEKMMISVPPKFEAKISAIEESCDLDTLTVSELTSKLQAQEQRVSIRSEEKVEGAFRVSSRSNKGSTSQNYSSTPKKGTFPPCNICQNTNHEEANCWFKDKPNFKCNFCNKFGHLEKYCRAKKAHNHTQGVQQANVSEEDQVDDEYLFMASHLDEHPNSLTWLMDSGCTSHMTPERSFFITLDTTDNPRVKLGDGRYTRAKGRAILDMVNDSYYLKLDVANASDFSVTEDEDDSMKWHKRIGHFNYKTLRHMNTAKLESCNSVIEPESYIDASRHSEWTDSMKAELEEEIYVKQPQVFEIVGQYEKAYRSYNSGPKQAPKVWFAKIDSHYLNHKLRRSSTENHVQDGRSKHINFKFHVIREAEKNEEVKLKYCTSKTQLRL